MGMSRQGSLTWNCASSDEILAPVKPSELRLWMMTARVSWFQLVEGRAIDPRAETGRLSLVVWSRISELGWPDTRWLLGIVVGRPGSCKR